MSPRLKRLNLEFERIKVRFASWPLLQLTASSGSPPEQYEFTYFVKSVYMSPTGDILEREQHVLEVNLSLGYPRRAPQCKMLTPVFHPNFDDSAVCIGDFWAASEGLEDLVIRIGRMLTYQDYNIKSPLNGLAARWAAEHPERLPVDPREIAPPAPSVVKPTGVSPVAEPPPLPQTNGLRITIVVDPPQPMPIVVTTPPPALPESLQSPAAPPSSDSADRAGLPAENEPAAEAIGPALAEAMPIEVTTPPPALPEPLQPPVAPPSFGSTDHAGLRIETQPVAEAIGPALAEAMPIEVTTPPPALPEPLQPPAAPPSSDSADHAGLRIETQPVAEAIGPAFAEPTPIEVTTPPPALPEPLQPPVGPPSFSSADRAGLPTEIEPAAEAIGSALAEPTPIEVTTPPLALAEPLQPPAAPPYPDSTDHAGLRTEIRPVAEAIGPARARAEISCPACKALAKDGARFCQACGIAFFELDDLRRSSASKVRLAFLRRANTANGSEAMAALRQMLQRFPKDPEGVERLDALEQELGGMKSQCCRLLEEARGIYAVSQLELARARFPQDFELQSLLKRGEEMLRESKLHQEVELSRLKKDARELLEKGEHERALLQLQFSRKQFPNDVELEVLYAWVERAAEKSAQERSRVKVSAQSLLESGQHSKALVELEAGRTKYRDDLEILSLHARACDGIQEQRTRLGQEVAKLTQEVRHLLGKGAWSDAVLQVELGRKRLGIVAELEALGALAQEELSKADAQQEAELGLVKREACRLIEATQYEKALARIRLALVRFAADPEIEALRSWAQDEQRKAVARLDTERTRVQTEARRLAEAGDWQAAVLDLKTALSKFGSDSEMEKLLDRAEIELRKQKEQLAAEFVRFKEDLAKMLEAGDYDRVLAALDVESGKMSGDADLRALYERAERERGRVREQAKAELAHLKEEVCRLMEACNYGLALAQLQAAQGKFASDVELDALLHWGEDEQRKAVARSDAERTRVLTEARRLAEAGDWQTAVLQIKTALSKFGGDSEMEKLLGRAEIELRKQKEQLAAEFVRFKEDLAKMLEAGDYDRVLAALDVERGKMSGDADLRALYERAERERGRIREQTKAELAHLKEEVCRLMEACNYGLALAQLRAAQGKFASDVELDALLRWGEDEQRKAVARSDAERTRVLTEARRLTEAGDWQAVVLHLKTALSKFDDDSEMEKLLDHAEIELRKQKEQLAAEFVRFKEDLAKMLEAGDYDRVLAELDVERGKMSGDADLRALYERAERERGRIREQTKAELAHLKEEVCRLMEACNYGLALAQLRAAQGKFASDVELDALLHWGEDEQRKAVARSDAERTRVLTEARRLAEAGDWVRASRIRAAWSRMVIWGKAKG